MEIEYIKNFITLAKHGNYLAAAEARYISQSSLSKHIMALEKELGEPLFSRTTRKVSLTPFGGAFLPYAQRIAEAEVEFQNAMAAKRKEHHNAVCFGVLPAFIFYHIDRAILEFEKQFPQFSISMVEGSNEELLRFLKDGICNLALIRTFHDPLPPEYVSIPLLKDRLALITLSGNYLSSRSSMEWKELETVDLLTSTSQLQSKILDMFTEEFSIRLNVVAKLSRTSSIVDLLHRGIGTAALLNRRATEYYHNDDSLTIVDLEPPIYNTVSLVYRKDRPLTCAMQDFIDIVSAYAQGEFIYV